MNFSPVSQNSVLSSKLISICQNKPRVMFGFQNRASEAYKSKLHAKRCNDGYLEKCIFSTVTRLINLRPPLDCGIETSLGVVSIFSFEF